MTELLLLNYLCNYQVLLCLPSTFYISLIFFSIYGHLMIFMVVWCLAKLWPLNNKGVFVVSFKFTIFSIICYVIQHLKTQKNIHTLFDIQQNCLIIPQTVFSRRHMQSLINLVRSQKFLKYNVIFYHLDENCFANYHKDKNC